MGVVSYIRAVIKCVCDLQDLNELVGLCSSSQWAERRDGIAQLHMLLESSRTFS